VLSSDLIARAARGEVSAFVELDRLGLLLGAHESAAQYAARLDCLRANTTAMDRSLAEHGTYEIEGIAVLAQERIPPALFEEAREVTETLFAFAVSWVPGFFINPVFGWLFGGCAFHFYPDFFALFIIRKSFADRARWLIYGRRELLAHELCHIARIGLGSHVFEETFAYRTATSAFRRAAGSVFRSPWDAFGLLLSVFLLLIAQLTRVFLLPTLWIWPFWAAVLAVVGWLAWRQWRCGRVFARALRNVTRIAPDRALAVLFRCTDGEIVHLARVADSATLLEWVGRLCESNLRWQVIRERFLPASTAGGVG